ncbi:MAG: membrane protein insertion efficiency factor YidD [Candidatus Levybacteria bacterium RIFCSPHIGHO2_01_FULL_37_17]|nr:MAG: membrane protein insertion efficiency factor YidD [Candidatus Levybacteria bacterium RIFCSPHIGHO2_01_FULL_37_17]OGH36433.1 MAG: membrane protein insertion efficiency factor YidD [Candidatus Levybacteria bacterium RIFCSPLOWO2_01_FULL_38_23]
MKIIFITLLNVYQKFLSPLLKQALGFNNSCRFYPTCSEYAKIQISEKGILKGTTLAIERILKCQPFYNPAKI